MRQVDQRMDVLNARSAMRSVSLVKAAWTVSGVTRPWAAVVGSRVDQGRGQNIEHGKEDCLERLALMLMEEQVVKVAMAIFEGKQGSIEPRLEPVRYISPVVTSE